MLLLQFIVLLIDAFQEDLLKSKPQDVLIFVDFALGEPVADAPKEEAEKEKKALITPMDGGDSLLSAPEGEGLFRAAATTDDGAQRFERASEGSEELFVTALNLLLALLEGQSTRSGHEAHIADAALL